jgi:hypothetical protein
MLADRRMRRLEEEGDSVRCERMVRRGGRNAPVVVVVVRDGQAAATAAKAPTSMRTMATARLSSPPTARADLKCPHLSVDGDVTNGRRINASAVKRG